MYHDEKYQTLVNNLLTATSFALATTGSYHLSYQALHELKEARDDLLTFLNQKPPLDPKHVTHDLMADS